MTQPHRSTARSQAPKPLPHVITAKTMRIAWLRGEVRPLSPQIDNCVQYLGYWWINDDTEWIRVTAQNAIDLLNAQKIRSASIYRNLHAKRGEEPA
ncbi:hypothetical protein [Glycomyces harbinensis]|uniref:Uncharacterized protein n=1 Tax=Glycomyces harbinensis TaxID=58114 RepID=A0A1G6QUW0_9ACTN|nr:hypothetical protein [Glycomyces harbinensis]SDC96053.1 hypothetical protein SAMN05216270_101125 [Glycomyces harbinensis]